MKRRDFFKSALVTGGVLGCAPRLLHGQAASPVHVDPAVKRVLIMFKCHFDLGFIDTQVAIIHRYFEKHFPEALRISSVMRQISDDRYVWTTGSWLLYEYLEHATGERRKVMEQAVGRGDIAWHALPYTWQTEFLDRSMIVGMLGLSRSLDRRFGRTTTGCKMTDVTGHSRGLVGPLAENGIKMLDVGANGGCNSPELPPLFLWKDTDGNSLVTMFHPDYGGLVQVPGSDLAVDIEVKSDNLGPHSIYEIMGTFWDMRQRFPNATVTAANLTDIANAIEPFRDKLPVVTQEVADSWIYGVPSDPVKVARYRELARLRQAWIRQGKFQVGDATDIALLRKLALAAEHTWGADTVAWLDFEHLKPADLAKMLDAPGYKVMSFSWQEKRDNLSHAIATLPQPLRAEATRRVGELEAKEPSSAGLEPHAEGAALESSHFVVALDPKTGAISQLRSKKTGREWASPEHPLALFSYQTQSKADFDRFLANYVRGPISWWQPLDLGKPNIERLGAESREWIPQPQGVWAGRQANGYRLLERLQITDPEPEREGRTAWPQRMYLELVLPDAEPTVEVSFLWFGKKATRMPEALWLSFLPQAPQTHGWTMEKVERPVSPFEVVRGGNRHMHALSGTMSYEDAEGKLSIEAIDAPVVALGEKSPIFYSNDQPDLAKGIHFSLFNNAYGTNYILWFSEDMRFRFKLHA
jgi:hypothetical protein